MLGTGGARLQINRVKGGGVSPAWRGAQVGEPVEPTPYGPPWADTAKYPIVVMDNAVASFDGKVCSLGGGDGSSTYANSYVYDVAANTWTRIADLPLPVNGASAAVIDGLVYVFGGWGSTGSPSARAQV